MSDSPIPAGPNAPRVLLGPPADLAEVASQATECLHRGAIVSFPTDAGQTLAASALKPAAVARLAQRGGSANGERPVGQIALLTAAELPDWIGPPLPSSALRLSQRGWPGPLTLLLSDPSASGLCRVLDPLVRDAVRDPASIGFRCPSDPLAREILLRIVGPLVLARAVLVSGASASSSELGPGDLILEAASPRPPLCRPTVVRLTGDQIVLLREGAVDEPTIRRWSATNVLLICTGNTCRSPMAESLLKVMLSKRLNCTPGELEARGFVIRSAGLGAIRGMPAAANAIEAVKPYGGSLAGHASQLASPTLVRQSDLVLAMTGDHLNALMHYYPEMADKTFLVNPAGEDVDDPVGLDLANYQSTAREIAQHLQYWVDRLIPA